MAPSHLARASITVAALALTACAPALVNQQSEEDAIRAVTGEWQRAIVAHDVDRIVNLHAPDALVMMSNSPLANGRQAIRSAYAGMLGIPGISLTWTPTRIDVASPTVATDYGTYTMAYDSPQGRVSDRGNYTTIWHKLDGQWKVAVDAPVSMAPMPAPTTTAAMAETGDMQLMAGGGMTWTDFSSPGFDPGTKLAVLHGNPMGKGDYTIRLMFPDGYRFPLHHHPGAEHLTVISGTFLLGMGNTVDWNAVRAHAPGDFLYVPPAHAHYGGARGVTVVQLHGEGPFQIVLGPGK